MKNLNIKRVLFCLSTLCLLRSFDAFSDKLPCQQSKTRNSWGESKLWTAGVFKHEVEELWRRASSPLSCPAASANCPPWSGWPAPRRPPRSRGGRRAGAAPWAPPPAACTSAACSAAAPDGPAPGMRLKQHPGKKGHLISLKDTEYSSSPFMRRLIDLVKL